MCLFESVATLANVSANVVLTHHVVYRPRDAVPVRVLFVQVVGNALWIAHSARIRDLYLAITATMSITMQCTGIVILLTQGDRGDRRSSSPRREPIVVASACD